MKDLHQFLSDHLKPHQERMRDLRQLSQGVARTLLSARKNRWYWPYTCRVTDDDQLEPQYKGAPAVVGPPSTATSDREASISTQAMICASIDRVLLRDDEHKILTDKERNDLCDARRGVETQVVQLLQSWVGETPFLESSTFGVDDVFTASWLLLMYSGQRNWREKERLWTPEIKRRLVGIIANSIVKTVAPGVEIIDYDRGLFVFEKGRNEAGPHSLPLLKVIKALEVIKGEPSLQLHWQERFKDKEKGLANAIRQAGDWLEKNLHRQMSFYRFKDFRFDAAELIFCLDGSIATGRITAYESIVVNVLDVVREAQERSVYWRPYRPMTSSSQGGVLLPLSIEVAMALLKTLKETNKFVEYGDTLEQYFKWLCSERLVPSGSREGQVPAWVGWHSENAYESKVIHVWDTALVGGFLCDLLDTKDTYFQEEVLSASSFTVEKPYEMRDEIVPALEKMISPDLGLATHTITSRLVEDFNWKKGSLPKKFSILAFGPPGSSKTTLARAIAKSLEWTLVYLSPSNFITSGEAGIEQQAKDIFDALETLRNRVILFDEIDRLILDRDSDVYASQAEMFQLMTPSMLAKFGRLRDAERCIFIIATNYEERIDKAVKRKGRIDESIAWLPMDLAARIEQFKRFIDGSFPSGSTEESWNSKTVESLRGFAMRCVLRIYPELKECFEKARRQDFSAAATLDDFRTRYVQNLSSLADTAIPAPEVSLGVYRARTIDAPADYKQRAYLEYACLLLIQGESEPDGQAKTEFKKLMAQWPRDDREDFDKKSSEVRRRAKAYGLETWLQ